MAAVSRKTLFVLLFILVIISSACKPKLAPEPPLILTSTAKPTQTPEPSPTPYPTQIPQLESNCPPGGWSIYTEEDGLSDNWPRTLAVDPDGRVYVGYTRGDISFLLNGIWTTFPDSPGSPSNQVNKILPLNNGDIWAGTQTGYIALYHEDAWKMWSGIFVDGENTSVYDLESAPDGRVWAATWDGVFQLQGDKWQPLSKPVLENTTFSVKSVHLDRDGGLWVGARYGLHYFKDGGWKNITTGHEPIYDVVTIEEDQFGNLWFGYLDGILFYDGDAWQKVYPAVGSSDSESIRVRVDSLALGMDGRIWAANHPNATVYEDGRWNMLIPDVEGYDIQIFQVDTDPWGAAWFISNEGVLCYNP